MENRIKEVYAGFWIRVVASFIDVLILLLPSILIDQIFGEDSILSMILFLVLWWFYSAKMISSSWEATIGKKMIGIKVTNIEGEGLTFKEASVRFILSIVSYGFLLPVLMMLFTDKKQTFHDYFAKTVVIDKVAIVMKNRQDTASSVMVKEEKIGFTRLIRGVGIFIIVAASAYFLYYITMFAFVFGSIASHKSQEYQTTLQKYHTIDDKNDSRIVFYVKELEKAGEEYLYADKVPIVFKARVKRKLALNCIGYFLQEHNDDTWLDQVQAVDRNQLNAYAQNTTIYNKRKSDENWNFYDHYYFNELYEAQEKIASSFEKEVSQQSCEKLQTAEEMFHRFLLPYINTKENTLRRYIEDEQSAPYFGTLNKRFYQKSIKDKKKLLKILYKGFPQIGEIQKQKTIEKQKIHQLEITNFFDKASGKIKMLDKYDCEEVITKEIAFDVRNPEGQTPLIVSVREKNFKMTGCLLGRYHPTKDHITHIKQRDKYGKTANDYYEDERDSILRNHNNLTIELIKTFDELVRYSK